MRSTPTGRLPFLDRRLPLGMSHALVVLIVFFFLLPFAFQSARLSLATKENDVKDWLPSEFRETSELSWFANHFAGESFVLATWPGCTTQDQRLRLLEDKLLHESSGYQWDDQDASNTLTPDQITIRRRARELGQELGLLYPGDGFHNWGGQKEKWLHSSDGHWFYVTPDGHLSRWNGSVNGPAGLVRAIQRAIGRFELEGQFITALGPPTNEQQTNDIYNDPTLLCAPLFSSVQTGESMVADLAGENGLLRPVGLTAEEYRDTVARRTAMQRLTGSLFAPAVPQGFDWSPQSFRDVILADQNNNVATADDLPSSFDATVKTILDEYFEEHLQDQFDSLASATSDQQSNAWYEVFDALEIQPPARMTAIVVTLTDVAKNNLAYALGRGVLGGPRGRLLALAEECGLKAADPPSMAPPPFNRVASDTAAGQTPLRIGGPPVDNVAIDEEGTITLVRLVGYSVLVGIVLSYLCFASVKITIMVFVVGGSAAMLSMACVGWTNGRVDAILMSMPSLVYVLGLSGAIHVVNYYRDEVRSRGLSGAAGRALRHAVVPCTLASVTTAIGLASLYTSNLVPISNFGTYSAIGVIATLAILFSYLPAALNVFAPTMDAPKSAGEAAESTAPQNSRFSEWWANIGRWITDHHVPVSMVCATVMVVVALGISKIETSVQLLKLFDPGSRIIRDYGWIESNFGKLVPMELVVRMPTEIQQEKLTTEAITSPDREYKSESAETVSLDMAERIEAVSRVRTVIQRTLGETGRGVVGQATSMDTFLPELPPGDASRYTTQGAARARIQNELLENYDDLIASDYVQIEKSGPFQGSELWRVSLRVGALTDVDYGQFIDSLRQSVEPVLRAYETREQLLLALAESPKQNNTKSKSRPRVLVFGSDKPEPLKTCDLVSVAQDESEPTTSAGDDGESEANQAGNDTPPASLAQQIYLATLGELLANESINVAWNMPRSDEVIRKLDSPQWRAAVEKVDAVVFVGHPKLDKSVVSTAKVLIDAESILQRQAKPILRDGSPDVEVETPIQVVYTGVVPVVYKAQRTLLASLGESIGLAFVLIAGVMIVLLNPARHWLGRIRPTNFANGFSAGWVAMIPNVFPVLLVFGAMGHLNDWMPGSFLVDIGTMMTASVAMGVAVDDTIHFLSWFRSYLDKGFSRRDAVIETYRRVGPAMTQTTIVGGIGLSVFALSTFTPTQRFGTLMLVLLAAALVGDLIFLPALLVGPLGRFFKPRQSIDGDEPDPDPKDMSGGDSSLDEEPKGFEEPTSSDDDVSPDESEVTETIIDREGLPTLKLHVPPSHQTADMPSDRKKR